MNPFNGNIIRHICAILQNLIQFHECSIIMNLTIPPCLLLVHPIRPQTTAKQMSGCCNVSRFSNSLNRNSTSTTLMTFTSCQVVAVIITMCATISTAKLFCKLHSASSMAALILVLTLLYFSCCFVFYFGR